MAQHKSGCLLCGEELHYHTTPRRYVCAYCGDDAYATECCPAGHYVCDACHHSTPNDLIERTCVAFTGINPIVLAELLFQNPAVKMHGPEHHFLVPAVLLSVFCNASSQPQKKEGFIHTSRLRAEPVKGGFCGFQGTCAAAIGTGIFMSTLTGTTPLSVEGWRLSNRVSARSLLRIAEYGGPRCCKRDVYLALLEAAVFIKEHYQIVLEMPESVVCQLSHLNRQCIKQECPFYPPSADQKL